MLETDKMTVLYNDTIFELGNDFSKCKKKIIWKAPNAKFPDPKNRLLCSISHSWSVVIDLSSQISQLRSLVFDFSSLISLFWRNFYLLILFPCLFSFHLLFHSSKDQWQEFNFERSKMENRRWGINVHGSKIMDQRWKIWPVPRIGPREAFES